MNTEQLHSISAGLEYYDGADLVDTLIGALNRAGLDPDSLDIDDLAPLDEFHALGRAATLALAELAAPQPEQHVLDVGAGIGGPARFLAARYHLQVTALDATARFCKVSELLTRGAGLADRVSTVCDDALALPFADQTFDLVWTQALSQNVANKQLLVDEMTRVVRPGGRIAMFEILAGAGGAVIYPVPWADRPEQSWLASGDELHELLDSAPLSVVTWNQGQAALDLIVAAARSVPPPRIGGELGLHVLMPDFEARMTGLARNVAEQRIAIVQAVAQRSPG